MVEQLVPFTAVVSTVDLLNVNNITLFPDMRLKQRTQIDCHISQTITFTENIVIDFRCQRAQLLNIYGTGAFFIF